MLFNRGEHRSIRRRGGPFPRARWTTAGFFRIELPLLAASYVAGYFLLRDSRARSYIAALPLLTIYVAHDLYYSWYGNVFRLADVAELPELLEVLSIGEMALYSTILVVPLLQFVAFVQPVKGLLTAAPGLARRLGTYESCVRWIHTH